MSILDIMERDYVIRNGTGVNYTIPYRCLVGVSNYDYDEDGLPTIRITRTGGFAGATNTTTVVYLLRPLDGGTGGGGFNYNTYLAKAGDVLTVDAPDDLNASVYFIRLPENP